MPPARSNTALPAPTPDQRRIAIENFDRARQVMGNGQFDYAIQMLLTCCKIDPGNFGFRQMLRRAQKEIYGRTPIERGFESRLLRQIYFQLSSVSSSYVDSALRRFTIRKRANAIDERFYLGKL